jgi:hypothetical protein
MSALILGQHTREEAMSGSQAPSIIEFTRDLDDQQEPELLPTGDYPSEIAEASFKISNTSGNTYLALRLRISPDQYPPDFVEGEPDGTDVMYNRLVVLPETAQSRWRLKKFLNAIGAKPGKSLDPSELIGLTCTLHVEQNEYEGEKQLQARKILAS